MEIIYSPKFEREYKKLPNKIKELAEEKERLFRHNFKDERLNAHKLHGRLKHFWSFSIDHRFRIIFEFAKNDAIHFHSVGDHDIYR
ncbi:MAG: type II toxin-antitoxin system mRNA interferase toxin, RelE/StbE family [Patescibacteria group bacterium]|nr:type II toxin-antitoxin system mRNA interferase toxin, RelE/StbE family [Patescibacteria group bacterium]